MDSHVGLDFVSSDFGSGETGAYQMPGACADVGR